MNRYILFSFMFLVAVGSMAQEVKNERTIVVEKEYNPDINDADKINVLPGIEKKSAPKTDVEYSVAPNVYDGGFAFSPMGLVYNKQRPEKAKHLYMYAGYGNNGHADAGLYYNSPLFRNNEFKFNVAFDGVNDKRKPFDLKEGVESKDWNARYYGTESNLNYTHHFDIMDLYVDGQFGLDNFNYHPALDGKSIDDRQRHTKAGARIGIKSDNDESFLYNIFVDYTFFDKAYNNEYSGVKNNENAIRLNALLGYEFNENSKIGFDFIARNYNYSMSGINDFTTINIHPSYRLRKNNISLLVGLNLDIAVNSDAKVCFSPDVAFDYTFARNYNVYASVSGGRTEMDYRFLERVNPYWNPNFMESSVIDFGKNYKALEIGLGLKGSPVEGLMFDINAGYDINMGDIMLMPAADDMLFSQYSSMIQHKTSVVYGALDMSYSFKNRFKISVDGKFMKWGMADDLYLGMKPKAELGAGLDAMIIKDMYLNVSYRHITRNDKHVAGNINDLSAKLSYRFLKGLGAYIKAYNIISADNRYYYAYPSSGASVLIGLDYCF